MDIIASCSSCSSCVFFFFKQKTAYEMRISDWSSDVCSSDLLPRLRDHLDPVADEAWLVADELLTALREALFAPDLAAPLRECLLLARDRLPEIGRASCRERMCKFV